MENTAKEATPVLSDVTRQAVAERTAEMRETATTRSVKRRDTAFMGFGACIPILPGSLALGITIKSKPKSSFLHLNLSFTLSRAELSDSC